MSKEEGKHNQEEDKRNKENLKYQRLYSWGRSMIISGVLKDKERFPSEHILQKKFGYSRQTIRVAVGMLEEDGYVRRIRGSGTYVSYGAKDVPDEKPRIGLILSTQMDYLFPQVYDGIESVLKEKGYELATAITSNRLCNEAIYLETLLSGNVSGYLIEGTCSAFPNPNIRFYKEILKRKTPVLFIHNHYANQKFDSVEMSDAKGAYALTQTLIQNGHHKIGGIFKYDDFQGVERYRGYIECLSDYRIRIQDDWICWYSTNDMKEKFAKKNLQEIYNKAKDCTAMILYNDEAAMYYIKFLKEQGIRVPDDISLVSFDDAYGIEGSRLKVLSVEHPKYMLGRIAARSLLRMMEDDGWQYKNYSYKFPVKLNNGNSVRNIRGEE